MKIDVLNVLATVIAEVSRLEAETNLAIAAANVAFERADKAEAERKRLRGLLDAQPKEKPA